MNDTKKIDGRVTRITLPGTHGLKLAASRALAPGTRLGRRSLYARAMLSAT
jgi:hypothetical protein